MKKLMLGLVAAFAVTAGGETASVTNDAAKLTDGAAISSKPPYRTNESILLPEQ